MMQTYQEYAKVYDRSGQLAFSLKMIRYLNTLLERYPLEGRRLLELACGTGTVPRPWPAPGGECTGSTAPRRGGRAKAARGRQRRVQPAGYALLPARRARAPGDLPHDSVNYMLSSESAGRLPAGLRRWAGGLFFFDMNTAYALGSVGRQVHYSDEPDITVIFRSAMMTSPTHHRGGHCVRSAGRAPHQEEHTEQAYRQAGSHPADRCGLYVEAYYDCFSLLPADDETFRVMWVAARAPPRAEREVAAGRGP